MQRHLSDDLEPCDKLTLGGFSPLHCPEQWWNTWVLILKKGGKTLQEIGKCTTNRKAICSVQCPFSVLKCMGISTREKSLVFCCNFTTHFFSQDPQKSGKIWQKNSFGQLMRTAHTGWPWVIKPRQTLKNPIINILFSLSLWRRVLPTLCCRWKSKDLLEKKYVKLGSLYSATKTVLVGWPVVSSVKVGLA